MQGLSAATKEELRKISAMLMETPALWTHYKARILQVMLEMDQAEIMRDADNLPKSAWELSLLQRYATSNHRIMDSFVLASWCERQWLKILQDDPDNVMALTRMCFHPLTFIQRSLVKSDLLTKLRSRAVLVFSSAASTV